MIATVCRGQNRGFKGTQFIRDKAFGVNQSLTADVVFGHPTERRLGDFHIIPEDLVETDLEVGNLSAFPLLLFILGQPARSIGLNPPQFVQVSGDAGTNQPALFGRGFWLVEKGARNLSGHIVQQIDFFTIRRQQTAPGPRQGSVEVRQANQSGFQGGQVSRVGNRGRNA